MIHYIYYMTVALLPKVFKLTSRPVFTMLFTIKLSDCQVVKANTVYHIGLPLESTVYICVEYSQMMLN